MRETRHTPESDRDAFDAWQNAGFVHPFTCGGGGGPCSGVDLCPAVTDGRVELLCPHCGRVQDPSPFMTDMVRRFAAAYPALAARADTGRE